MNLIESIVNKVFPKSAGSAPAPTPAAAFDPNVPSAGNFAPTPSGLPLRASASATDSLGPPVDATAVLTEMARNSKGMESLNWKESIVDLLKLLKMDSGIDARKQLARELGYDGDGSDSAKMNVWLHERVMQRLAQNDGKFSPTLH